MNFEHIPVLLEPILEYFPTNAKTMIDCTLGGAGHSTAILKKHPDLFLYGIDRDQNALAEAERKLSQLPNQHRLIHNSFAEGARQLLDEGIKADFILADLGVSSHQLDCGDRGFSFRSDAPLDMRMNVNDSTTAADIVNETEEKELARIIRIYGEDSFAPKIARNIVKTRQKKPFQTTWELADCIREAVPKKFQFGKLHPATKTFQAIRIVVNQELEELNTLLNLALDLLNFGGRLAIISFHSLEDRPVKKMFRKWENPCECSKELPICICGLKPRIRSLHRKMIQGSKDEIQENPRARSAKLRVVEKI